MDTQLIRESGYHPIPGNYNAYFIDPDGIARSFIVDKYTEEEKIINRKELDRVLSHLFNKYNVRYVPDKKEAI